MYLTACFLIIDCRSASKFSDRFLPLGHYIGLWINNSKFSDWLWSLTTLFPQCLSSPSSSLNNKCFLSKSHNFLCWDHTCTSISKMTCPYSIMSIQSVSVSIIVVFCLHTCNVIASYVFFQISVYFHGMVISLPYTDSNLHILLTISKLWKFAVFSYSFEIKVFNLAWYSQLRPLFATHHLTPIQGKKSLQGQETGKWSIDSDV